MCLDERPSHIKYDNRGSWNYRTEDRAMVYRHLPSKSSAHFINRFQYSYDMSSPNFISQNTIPSDKAGPIYKHKTLQETRVWRSGEVLTTSGCVTHQPENCVRTSSNKIVLPAKI
ncbi:hypothetical protein J6590_102904 [Homalodisca vitripennis]|nr:hypothetical protein J6590_102904 [Homalodisca vitripennis]